jgi:molecular chaperone DnaK (HSP70)
LPKTTNRSAASFSTASRPAPRGIPQIEVTFNIDANGIVNVKATDKGTGKEQHITIQNSGNLSEDEVKRMQQEAEANAETDKKRKALIEARNHLDSLVYTAEKTLKDAGDKAKAEDKTASKRPSKPPKPSSNPTTKTSSKARLRPQRKNAKSRRRPVLCYRCCRWLASPVQPKSGWTKTSGRSSRASTITGPGPIAP